MESERERHAERLSRLAVAVRKAADRLPQVPISGEVVACAGIMGMANWLEDVAALLRRAEPCPCDRRAALNNAEAEAIAAWNRRAEPPQRVPQHGE